MTIVDNLLPTKDGEFNGNAHDDTPSSQRIEADAVEPIGYCVWINGKLAGCAKSHRGAFPVYASKPKGDE